MTVHWRPGYRKLMRGSLSAIHKTSIFPQLRRAAANSLTTLVYHRIGDVDSPGFFGLKSNVSATTEGFAAQIRYLCRNFDIVSLDDCIAWAKGEIVLPRNALLITFDDGYRDNLLNASPILKDHSVRAILFVATGFVADQQTFYWDWVWEAFHATQKKAAALPILGYAAFRSDLEAGEVAQRWISASKLIPDDQRKSAVAELAEVLEVAPPSSPPPGTCLDWQDIAALAETCFDFGSHTVNHPILSNISVAKAEREIDDSRSALERALGRRVRCFAYPNGHRNDFGLEHEALLQRLGFEVAFQGYGGIMLPGEVRRHRFAIRRTGVSLKDTPPVIAAKAAGLERLALWK